VNSDSSAITLSTRFSSSSPTSRITSSASVGALILIPACPSRRPVVFGILMDFFGFFCLKKNEINAFEYVLA
jgi:uncharacterized membrane protein YdcZ (DUF606 family)